MFHFVSWFMTKYMRHKLSFQHGEPHCAPPAVKNDFNILMLKNTALWNTFHINAVWMQISSKINETQKTVRQLIWAWAAVPLEESVWLDVTSLGPPHSADPFQSLPFCIRVRVWQAFCFPLKVSMLRLLQPTNRPRQRSCCSLFRVWLTSVYNEVD